jgi:hypothetical protein
MRRSKYTIKFEKLYGDIPDRKIPTLAKYFGIKKSLIQDVFNRGVGAYKTNPSSVREGVTSEEMWAKARVYKYILNVLKARRGEEYLQGRGHDTDLVQKAL